MKARTMAEVTRGTALPGLSPMNEEIRMRYEADKIRG
jgi:hypothetical protein